MQLIANGSLKQLDHVKLVCSCRKLAWTSLWSLRHQCTLRLPPFPSLPVTCEMSSPRSRAYSKPAA